MSRMDAMKLRPPEAGQQTYDCSKMYTSIRLPELKAKMDKYIDMVFEYQRQAAKPYGQAKHLKIHFFKATYHTGETMGKFRICGTIQ